MIRIEPNMSIEVINDRGNNNEATDYKQNNNNEVTDDKQSNNEDGIRHY
jgi:hypothetical protein